MTFRALHELVWSIFPASLPTILLFILSLALWASVLAFSPCSLSSEHSRILVHGISTLNLCTEQFLWSMGLCSNATSLVRSYFSYFCVLFIVLPPMTASSIRVCNCLVYHYVLYTYNTYWHVGASQNMCTSEELDE